jgi:hypothetical protein
MNNSLTGMNNSLTGMSNRLTKQTISLITSLPLEKKLKVDEVVRRHVLACRRNGFMPENMERVFIEAVEMVEMEERAPQSSQSVDVEVRDYEPLRRYEQYVSPRAA